jgi:hypothetical protein
MVTYSPLIFLSLLLHSTALTQINSSDFRDLLVFLFRSLIPRIRWAVDKKAASIHASVNGI